MDHSTNNDPLALKRAKPGTPEAGWQALAHLYHSFFTGLILQVSLQLGAETAGKWSYQYFRRQHHEKFLSSFEKLGAAGLPDAVAAARYHYLSNRIGGVEVEYMFESDKKAWVRFPHPRWIYDGTAICGVPIEVGHGFIHGWYGHNGVTLGNPRLGWVCTSQDVNAEIGYVGYFKEYDHDLGDDERVSFVSDETPPRFDPNQAPTLDSSIWTTERLGKARRNYAMDYVKWGIFELVEMLGPDTTRELSVHTAALISRQFYRDLQQRLKLDRDDDSAEAFARFIKLQAMAHGNDISWDIGNDGDVRIQQSGWRLVRGMSDLPAATTSVLFDAWNALWRGCLNVHNRFLTFETDQRPTDAGSDIVWRIHGDDRS